MRYRLDWRHMRSGSTAGDVRRNGGTSDVPEIRQLQPRAQRTRRSILLAAAKVFEREGYATATLEEIAQIAGTTKGSLYFHFKSKAELAAAIIEAYEATWPKIAAEVASCNLSALDAVVEISMQMARSFQSSAMTRAGTRLNNEYHLIDATLPVPFQPWIAHVADLLRHGQDEGTVASRVDCMAAARVIVGSFHGMQGVSCRLSNREDLNERVREWWVFMRPSLVASSRFLDESARVRPARAEG
jgi:TetR/AcrR family transcriptional repressor of uid operon